MNHSHLLAGLAIVAAAGGVAAQDYPNKSVIMVVPFAAGGPTDTVARIIAQPMSKALKQQVIIENTAGAGGTLASARVAKAAPDGYTLLLHHIGHATSATLYRKLPFDTINDFEPIGQVADIPMSLIGKKDLPANNLKELIVWMKANKEKVLLGNAGIGAASHLCGMLIQSALQTEFTTLPYKGTGPAMNDLLGGQFDIMCDQTTSTTGQIKGGRVKAYGVTTLKRVASLPDVPTLNEAGLPGFEVVVWQGIYAPKGTPKPVIDKLVAALDEALRDPGVKARLAELGSEPVPPAKATPEGLRSHLQAEVAKWAPIIKKAAAYAD
jgi:tripartite-type tricarboxylate transporter receptor subunit TctC